MSHLFCMLPAFMLGDQYIFSGQYASGNLQNTESACRTHQLGPTHRSTKDSMVLGLLEPREAWVVTESWKNYSERS